MLQKFSWLTVLISFYVQQDTEEFLKLNLFPTIVDFLDKGLPSETRAHAVLAISLLSHSEEFFDLIVQKNMIDVIL